MTGSNWGFGEGPIADLRVLDLLEGASGAYLTKLLAVLGADVVKVEPPSGDRLRRCRPFLADRPGGDRSLPWLHMNASKRGIALDLEAEADRERLRALLRDADVVVENRPVGELDRLGLGWAALHELNPSLVMTSITPFGQTGPRSGWRGSDIVGYASGGMMYMTGEADEPPVRLGGGQADHLAGLYGAVGTLAALAHRTVSGEGQRIDVSVQEAVAATMVDAGVTYYQFNDRLNPRRVGSDHPIVVPVLIAPCVDGWMTISGLDPHMFRSLMAWAREKGVDVSAVDDPQFDAPMSRLPLRDLIHLLIREATAKFTKAEVYAELQSRGVPAAPVSSVKDLAENEQLLFREFFTPVPLAEAERPVKDSGPPFRLESTPVPAPAAAPRLDQHREELERGSRPPRRPAGRTGRRGEPWGARRALTGLRVADFSAALAGPFAGRLMATEGAEVIRVEAVNRLDALRSMSTDPERAGAYINTNAGKMGISLDITVPEGLEVAKALIAESDVMVENYRPGVMESAGLGWEAVRKVNPSLIMCSMPAQGGSGPHREYTAYAPTLNGLTGFTYLTGFPESVPTAFAAGFIDQMAGAHAVVGILAALYHRDRTGEGQHIDLSQFEAGVGMLGSAVLEYFANHRVPERQGNRDPNAAPHGCYACRDEDTWIAIAVGDDEQWTRLVEAMGRADLGEDEDLRTLEGRLQRAAELDREIAAWTAERDAQELMVELQAAGVAAGAVQTMGDLLERDAHLAARGFYEDVDHEVAGRFKLERAGFLLEGTPGSLEGRAGPLLGQHNDHVLSEILGLSEERIDELRAKGVVGPRPGLAATSK